MYSIFCKHLVKIGFFLQHFGFTSKILCSAGPSFEMGEKVSNRMLGGGGGESIMLPLHMNKKWNK